ncbi:hypothetical protein Tco_0784619 [Tanacetum coccineum]
MKAEEMISPFTRQEIKAAIFDIECDKAPGQNGFRTDLLITYVLIRIIILIQGKEVDLESLKKMSIDYAMAKVLAIKGAEKVIDTQDINHLAENQTLIGDVGGKTITDWNIHNETFYQKTRLNKRQVLQNHSQVRNENIDAVELNV